MAFKKGDDPNRGKGRPKGLQNRTTTELKDMLNSIISKQFDNMEDDLVKLKKTNPAKALELSIKLIEYVIPKLQKTNISGELNLNQKIETININIKKSLNL